MQSQTVPGGDCAVQERRLLEECKAGNRERFELLVQPYLRSIQLITYSILRHKEDTEEVVQEVLLKAFMQIGQLREEESFKAWLLQIAGNESRLRIRKDRKHLYESIEQDTMQKPFHPREFIGWRDVPSRELERKEVRDALAAALDCLEDGYREVFILRDIQHLSAAETGKILGIKEGTVNTRLHRARMQMREELTPLFKLPGRGVPMMSLKMLTLMSKTLMRKIVSCQHVTQRISAYIDEQLAPEMRSQIEEHLKYCDRCLVLVDTTRKLLYFAADEKVFAVPFESSVNWEHILGNSEKTPPNSRPPSLPQQL